MSSHKSKKDLKYLDKIAKKHLVNKTRYFRRNLHLNHKDTGIKIVRIRDNIEFFYNVKGLKELESTECFYIYHLDSSNLTKWVFNIKDSDMIYTDSKTNKVIAINEILSTYPDFINIWIGKKNLASFLNIKKGDVVFTR